MNKIKLIFFDMEGTIFKRAIPVGETRVAPSAWLLIAENLGQLALQEEINTQNKWLEGKYSNYIEWMEETIRIHKKYGLKKELFYRIINKVEYTYGAKETFEQLNRKNVVTALVTGGFKAQADRAILDLHIKHSFAACEYFWDRDGNLAHWNLLPADYKGKVNFMKMLIEEYGLKAGSCAYIGDSDNDVELAREVGLSIAFNASEGLQKVACISINQMQGKENLFKILEYITI